MLILCSVVVSCMLLLLGILMLSRVRLGGVVSCCIRVRVVGVLGVFSGLVVLVLVVSRWCSLVCVVGLLLMIKICMVGLGLGLCCGYWV